MMNMITHEWKLAKLRQKLGDEVKRVYQDQEPVLISHYSDPIAAIISIDQFNQFQTLLETQLSSEAAQLFSENLDEAAVDLEDAIVKDIVTSEPSMLAGLSEADKEQFNQGHISPQEEKLPIDNQLVIKPGAVINVNNEKYKVNIVFDAEGPNIVLEKPATSETSLNINTVNSTLEETNLFFHAEESQGLIPSEEESMPFFTTKTQKELEALVQKRYTTTEDEQRLVAEIADGVVERLNENHQLIKR